MPVRCCAALMALMTLPLLSGCFNFRKAARQDPARPEFRGAGVQMTNPPPSITPPPRPDTPSSAEESALRRLARRAVDKERTLDAYYVRLRRREAVDGKEQPEEIILFKYRRAPVSVHCKWLGKEAHGREIVYVKGQHDDKIHILTGQGDILGPGRKMSFPPENPLVKSKFRYPVTEAGVGAAAVRFGALIDAIERGQPNAGSAKHLADQNRPEFPRPVDAVEQTIPPNAEPGLIRGGVRFYYFDPDLGLPTVIVTFDHTRQQVEYYHFDRLQAPVSFDDADFDPAALWKKGAP